MENWQLALTVLVAVLVGTAIPLVVQLMSTLRGLSALVRHTDELVIATRPGLERAVVEVGTAATRLNQSGSELLETMDGMKVWLDRFKQGATLLTVLGSAVAPVVADALRRHKENSGNSEKPNHVEKETES